MVKKQEKTFTISISKLHKTPCTTVKKSEKKWAKDINRQFTKMKISGTKT